MRGALIRGAVALGGALAVMASQVSFAHLAHRGHEHQTSGHHFVVRPEGLHPAEKGKGNEKDVRGKHTNPTEMKEAELNQLNANLGGLQRARDSILIQIRSMKTNRSPDAKQKIDQLNAKLNDVNRTILTEMSSIETARREVATLKSKIKAQAGATPDSKDED